MSPGLHLGGQREPVRERKDKYLKCENYKGENEKAASAQQVDSRARIRHQHSTRTSGAQLSGGPGSRGHFRSTVTAGVTSLLR